MADEIAVDFNQIGVPIALLSPQILALTLSLDRAVNLAKVAAYESREVFEEREVEPAKGNKPAVTESVTTGRFVPCVLLAGGEVLELTPEENDVFRENWRYVNLLSNYLLTGVKAIAEQIPQAAPAETADEPTEVAQ